MQERGVISAEASRTFREQGWFVKVTRDAVRCPRCGTMIYPDAASGCFDIRLGVPVWDSRDIAWYAVEVKYAKTAYPFSNFDEKKRAWAVEHDGDYAMWLWLGMGEAINNKRYPRVTYLFPLELFYQLERTLDRKSIPYGCPELDRYKLTWLGRGRWELHQDFLANSVFAKTVSS